MNLKKALASKRKHNKKAPNRNNFKYFLIMKKNVGSTDKWIRVIIALIIVALYFGNVITGTLAIVLLVVAGIFILTGFVGFCGLYTLLGINTCTKK
jgi:hypothetical protein